MTSLTKEQISSDKAPKALGPYSAGIRIGSLVFTAGQLGIIPATGDLATGGIEAETHQALENINAILLAAGTSIAATMQPPVSACASTICFRHGVSAAITSSGRITAKGSSPIRRLAHHTA